jgi:hypothetical protein
MKMYCAMCPRRCTTDYYVRHAACVPIQRTRQQIVIASSRRQISTTLGSVVDEGFDVMGALTYTGEDAKGPYRVGIFGYTRKCVGDFLDSQA